MSPLPANDMDTPPTPELMERLLAACDRTGDCWEWTRGKFSAGYGAIKVAGKVRKAHRMSFLVHNGHLGGKDDLVCHSCDNRSCINPDHLFLGKPGDNNRDRDAKGRQAWGEGAGNVSLCREDVARIRRQYAAGRKRRDIAADFGVSVSAVHRAATGVTWGRLA